MTAPHDTPEAVEAMAARLLDNQFLSREAAAAMLRRLHAAKVEAERERDAWKLQSNDWQKRGWELGSKLDAAEAALAALCAARPDVAALLANEAVAVPRIWLLDWRDALSPVQSGIADALAASPYAQEPKA